jgi:hypothetical protein
MVLLSVTLSAAVAFVLGWGRRRGVRDIEVLALTAFAPGGMYLLHALSWRSMAVAVSLWVMALVFVAAALMVSEPEVRP